MLKTIARLPIYLENWLGSGHTAQYEDGSPLSETAGYNSCVLLPSLGMENQYVKPLKLGQLWSKKIAFYQIFPLYQEELDFKLAHSLDELLDKMDMGDNYTDENLIIDIHRKNCCK
jgi:hypothetical protein